MSDLLIVVPSRSRPENVARLLSAWGSTGAWGVADLRIDIDVDDPKYRGYLNLDLPEGARFATWHRWRPMVHKLNRASTQEAGGYFALGFMGDDHCPETDGWAQQWITVLHELVAGIVYSADGAQNEKLPTHWAITSNIVQALGRMVPASVEHLFCDNSILDLGREAGCIRYLGHIMIRHRHFTAKLAPKDEQYARVNSRQQWRRDEAAYHQWRATRLAADVAKVRSLR